MLVPQRLEDRLGDVPHIPARVRPEARDDDAVLVERGDHRQVERLAQSEVLGAAAGGYVDDAGALLLTHLVPDNHAVLVGRLAVRACEGGLDGRQLVERAGVSPAFELAPGPLFQDLEGAFQGMLHRPAAQPVDLVALADLDVAQVLADGRGHV